MLELQQTPHISHSRARYGVSIVGINQPRYDGTPLHCDLCLASHHEVRPSVPEAVQLSARLAVLAVGLMWWQRPCALWDRVAWYVGTAIDLWALVAFGAVVNGMVTIFSAVPLQRPIYLQKATRACLTDQDHWNPTVALMSLVTTTGIMIPSGFSDMESSFLMSFGQYINIMLCRVNIDMYFYQTGNSISDEEFLSYSNFIFRRILDHRGGCIYSASSSDTWLPFPAVCETSCSTKSSFLGLKCHCSKETCWWYEVTQSIESRWSLISQPL